jgi:hypothetical protein
MSAQTSRGAKDASNDDRGGARSRGVRRLATETKASFKTSEFFAYLAVVAGILVAGLIISGEGANDPDGFAASRVWLYVTILTAGYMVSRGLAKSGSREPYTDD